MRGRSVTAFIIVLVLSVSAAPVGQALGVGDVGGGLGESIGDIGDIGGGLGESVGDIGGEVGDAVGGELGDAVDETTGRVGDTLDETADGVGGTVSSEDGSVTGEIQEEPAAPSSVTESTESDTAARFSLLPEDAEPGVSAAFEATAAAGQTVQLHAHVHNPFEADARVRLSVVDVELVVEGELVLGDEGVGVSAWIALDDPLLTVPGNTTADTGFAVAPPEGAEPGEHLAAIVAEIEAGEDADRMVVPVSVHVLGSARPEFAVENIQIVRDSTLFPREASLVIEVRNTGRVRLHTAVFVNDRRADGPEMLMVDAVERYHLTAPVSFFGGPLRFRIEAQSSVGEDPGPSELVRAQTFVVPWHLLLLAALAVAAVLLLRFGLQRLRGRRALAAEVRRLERLLEEQRAALDRLVATIGLEALLEERDAPSETAILAAMKQARRVGDMETERRLATHLTHPNSEDDDVGSLGPMLWIESASRDEPASVHGAC